VHGFRARQATADGRKVLKARRLKGRVRLAVKATHVKKINWNAAKSPAGRPSHKK
jgi:large subunit ribosomal protein L34